MDNYKERYIADITRRLPEHQRDDVAMELASLIDDMMEDGMSLEDALTTLGHPRNLANRYRDKPRYLISPEYFDRYLDSLKLVAKIVAISWCVIASILVIVEVPSLANNTDALSILIGVITLIAQQIGTGVSIIWTSLGIVTLVFALLDYQGAKLEEKQWTVDDLPPLEDKAIKPINKIECIVEIAMIIVFTALFIGVLNHRLNIPYYANGVFQYDILNVDAFSHLMPVVLIAALLTLTVSILKLSVNYISLEIAVINVISNGVSLVVAGMFLNSMPLKDAFILDMIQHIPNLDIKIVYMIIFNVIAVVNVIDSIHGLYLGIRNKRRWIV